MATAKRKTTTTDEHADGTKRPHRGDGEALPGRQAKDEAKLVDLRAEHAEISERLPRLTGDAHWAAVARVDEIARAMDEIRQRNWPNPTPPSGEGSAPGDPTP